MISIRPVGAHEWSNYRDVRLRALLDSPDAFGSTWALEAARADEDWATRIAIAATEGCDQVLFAFNGEEVCGLVWCKLRASEPEVADIYQMWVDPASRGLGAGHALLSQTRAWAQSRGVCRIRLGVTVADSPAMRLYQSHGFCPAGRTEPLRDGSDLMVQTMQLELTAIAVV